MTGICYMLAIFAAASATTASTPVADRGLDVYSLSNTLGLPASPNFTDEAAIWATTFFKTDDKGITHALQLPRVYTDNR